MYPTICIKDIFGNISTSRGIKVKNVHVNNTHSGGSEVDAGAANSRLSFENNLTLSPAFLKK